MKSFDPYISVVVAARNDNHGGNMLGRMQAFLNAWIGQAQRYGLESEIIVVEWNPPADRPKLMDCLEWPDDLDPCEVRFVEVPAEIHRRFRNPDTIPLHQMAAKNAGIRRARGKFVLATNLDILFSAELMQFLAERRLERRTIYRMDRHDVASAIPAQATVDQLLDYCQKNVLRVFTAEGGFEFAPDGLRKLEENDIVDREGGIRFGAGWYPVERYESDPFRWIAAEAEIIFQRPRDAEPRLLLDVEAGPSAAGAALPLEVIDAEGAVLASATLEGRAKLRLHMPDQISSGAFRLRFPGGRVAVANEARFLNLRSFGISWEGRPWQPQFAGARAWNDEKRAKIRVRSLDARQIQLALCPGEASLDNVEIRLSDRAGNVLFRVASGHLPAPPGEECLLTLETGFNFSRQTGGREPGGEERPAPGWLLEVTATRTATDWSATNQSASPFAHHMRNPAYLHTNGGGDFTLLSREDWWSLAGYAEFPIWPMHIDSLFCYAAHHAGLHEVVLQKPMAVFHIEHLSGAGWTPEGEGERVARIESKGVSTIQYQDLLNWIERMRRFNAPAIFTGSNWGLADAELPETSPGPSQVGQAGG